MFGKIFLLTNKRCLLVFVIAIVIYFLQLFFRKYKKNMSNSKYNNLNAKVVLITGASSGLGEALSHIFFDAGCKIILTGRSQKNLERVYHDLVAKKKRGKTYTPTLFKLDLLDIESMPEIVNEILKIHQGIDILINNAGISVRADILSSSIEVDFKVMNTNYFGAVALSKAVLPVMLQQGEGHIVFISSVQGKFAIPFRSAYCASKHALQAFSDSLRAEVYHNNIKVTCVSPGYIKTSLSKNALNPDGSKYDKIDTTTANGYDAQVIAKQILLSILLDKKDIILAQSSAHCAYWLRIFFPHIFFKIMSKRTKTNKI